MGWSCSHVWELQRRIITYWVTQGSCARIWTYQFVSGVTLVETQRYNCRVFCLIFDFHRLWFIPCVNQQHKLNAVIIQHLASFHGGNWRTSMSSSAFVLFVQLTQAPIRPLHCETVAHLLSPSLSLSLSLSLCACVWARSVTQMMFIWLGVSPLDLVHQNEVVCWTLPFRTLLAQCTCIDSEISNEKWNQFWNSMVPIFHATPIWMLLAYHSDREDQISFPLCSYWSFRRDFLSQICQIFLHKYWYVYALI